MVLRKLSRYYWGAGSNGICPHINMRNSLEIRATRRSARKNGPFFVFLAHFRYTFSQAKRARMDQHTPGEITLLINKAKGGDKDALDRLLPMVYEELRKIASSFLRREFQQQTLQTADLVHEAYIRLVGQDISWQNRSHFFGIAANAMRQILVDFARRRKADKRGGDLTRVSLSENVLVADGSFDVILELDEALDQLQKIDTRLGRVVELRYFSGLTVEETAEVLSVSPRTVKSDWNFARAWLHRTIGSPSPS